MPKLTFVHTFTLVVLWKEVFQNIDVAVDFATDATTGLQCLDYILENIPSVDGSSVGCNFGDLELEDIATNLCTLLERFPSFISVTVSTLSYSINAARE